MNKLFFISLFTLLGCTLSVHATEVDAVYAWVEGSSTCYRLIDLPKVTYVGNTAVLTIKGEEELRVELGTKNLVLTYGMYQDKPTDVEKSDVAPVEKVGKYIRGGRLIIVRDGLQYDGTGKRIY